MSIRIAATCRLRIHVTCRLYATCVIAYTMNLLILASVLLRGPYLYTAFLSIVYSLLADEYLTVKFNLKQI